MATMRGPDYLEDEVSNEETMNKLGALEHEMGKVYDYAQGKATFHSIPRPHSGLEFGG